MSLDVLQIPDSAAWRAGQIAERERILAVIRHVTEELCLPNPAYDSHQRRMMQRCLKRLAGAITEAP